MPAGPAVIRLEFVYDGGGIGKGATASLFVNGTKAGEARIPQTVPVNYSFDETFRHRTGYQHARGRVRLRPSNLQGSIQKIEIDTAPQNLSANDKKNTRRTIGRNRSGEAITALWRCR